MGWARDSHPPTTNNISTKLAESILQSKPDWIVQKYHYSEEGAGIASGISQDSVTVVSDSAYDPHRRYRDAAWLIDSDHHSSKLWTCHHTPGVANN